MASISVADDQVETNSDDDERRREAAALLNHDNETRVIESDVTTSTNQNESQGNCHAVDFGVLDFFFTGFFTILYLLNLYVDLYLACVYCYIIECYWYAILTLSFVLIPAVAIFIFTAFEYLNEKKFSSRKGYTLPSTFQWLYRIAFCLTPLPCYAETVYYGMKYNKELEKEAKAGGFPDDEREKVIGQYVVLLYVKRRTNDLLSLIAGFLGCAPQMLVQIHIVASTADSDSPTSVTYWQYASISVSILSLTWAVTSFIPMRTLYTTKTEEPSFIAIGLAFLTQLFGIGARAIAIYLFATAVNWIVWPVVLMYHFLAVSSMAQYLAPKIRIRQLEYEDDSRTNESWSERLRLLMYETVVFMFTLMHSNEKLQARRYFALCLAGNAIMLIVWFKLSAPYGQDEYQLTEKLLVAGHFALSFASHIIWELSKKYEIRLNGISREIKPMAVENGAEENVDGGPSQSQHSEMINFNRLRLFLSFASPFIYLVDLGLDIKLAVKYYRQKEILLSANDTLSGETELLITSYTWYFGLTLGFVVLPAAVMFLTCAREYLNYNVIEGHPRMSARRRVFRLICLMSGIFSPLPCFVDNIYFGWMYLKAKEKLESANIILCDRHKSEWQRRKKSYASFLLGNATATAKLRLVESFMECAPQLTLQLYIISTEASRTQHSKYEVGFDRYLSIATSLVGLALAVTLSRPLVLETGRDAGERESMTERAEPAKLTIGAMFICQLLFIFARALAIAVFASAVPWLVCPSIVSHFVGMFVWLSLVATECQHTLLFSAVSVFTYVPNISKFPIVGYFLVCFVENTIIFLWFAFSSASACTWHQRYHYLAFSGGILLLVHYEIQLKRLSEDAEKKLFKDCFSPLVEAGKAAMQKLPDCTSLTNWVRCCKASPAREIGHARRIACTSGSNCTDEESQEGCLAKITNWMVKFLSHNKAATRGRVHSSVGQPKASSVLFGIFLAFVRMLFYIYRLYYVIARAYSFYSAGHYWYFMLTVSLHIGSEAIISVSHVKKYLALRRYLSENDFTPDSNLLWAFRIFCLVFCVSPLAWSAQLLYSGMRCRKLLRGNHSRIRVSMLAIHYNRHVELAVELLREAASAVLTVYIVLTNHQDSVYGLSAWLSLGAISARWLPIIVFLMWIGSIVIILEFPLLFSRLENLKRQLAFVMIYTSCSFTTSARVIAIAAFASAAKWVFFLVIVLYLLLVFIWLRNRAPRLEHHLLFAAVFIITHLQKDKHRNAIDYCFLLLCVENALMLGLFFIVSRDDVQEEALVFIILTHYVLFLIGAILFRYSVIMLGDCYNLNTSEALDRGAVQYKCFLCSHCRRGRCRRCYRSSSTSPDIICSLCRCCPPDRPCFLCRQYLRIVNSRIDVLDESKTYNRREGLFFWEVSTSSQAMESSESDLPVVENAPTRSQLTQRP